jgi:hypothetical protein
MRQLPQEERVNGLQPRRSGQEGPEAVLRCVDHQGGIRRFTMRWIALLLLISGCAASNPRWKAEVKPIEKTITITVEGGF